MCGPSIECGLKIHGPLGGGLKMGGPLGEGGLKMGSPLREGSLKMDGLSGEGGLSYGVPWTEKCQECSETHSLQKTFP